MIEAIKYDKRIEQPNGLIKLVNRVEDKPKDFPFKQFIKNGIYYDGDYRPGYINKSGDVLRIISDHTSCHMKDDVTDIIRDIAELFEYKDDKTEVIYEEGSLGLKDWTTNDDELMLNLRPNRMVIWDGTLAGHAVHSYSEAIELILRDIRNRCLMYDSSKEKKIGYSEVFWFYHIPYDYWSNGDGESVLSDELNDNFRVLMNTKVDLCRYFEDFCKRTDNPKKQLLMLFRETGRWGVDIPVQLIGLDKVESQLYKTITTSKPFVYQTFFNYMLMGYDVTQINRYIVDKNGQLVKAKHNEWSYECICKDEADAKRELELIIEKVPLRDRPKYFR